MDHASDAMLALRAEYRQLDESHQLQLADENEPGLRLLLLGTLTSSETDEPLPYRRIQLYQTDTTGSYNASIPGQENTARLNGTVQTDSLGRFLISTVLPGGYGSGSPSFGTGHIHTSVEGAHPEAYDFYFQQGISRGLYRWARGTDQAVVLDLNVAENDTLMAEANLVVRGLATAEEP
ncbi:MAG: hypothetical protein R3284_01710 [Rubricoccaceae bacterium]|nr:hypothetical protein [Rubricoccaceae bacterium]